MATKPIKTADQFGQWLLEILQKYGYASLSDFINKNYPIERQKSAHTYLSCLMRTKYPMGKRFFNEFCNILKIPKSEQEHGLQLLADRKIARKTSQHKPAPEYLPTSLFCALAKLEHTKITLDDIRNIADVLNRLGEEYTNGIIIEQITEQYFARKT